MGKDLQKQIGEFGSKHEWLHSTGLIKHLQEEVDELKEALDTAKYPSRWCKEEAADCCIILFAIAHTVGFNLLRAVEEKQKINQKRTWLPPDEDGVVRYKENHT